MDKKKNHRTSIGGQAVLEGVMMRGVNKTALAVRDTIEGGIFTEEVKFFNVKAKYPILKLPIIRGAVGFIESLVLGYKTLYRSAELAGLELEEGEPTKFEKWITNISGAKIADVIMFIALVFGIGFSLLMFTILPAVITKTLDMFLKGALGGFKTLIEGVIRLTIFLLVLTLTAKNKDIHRVFEYHGAEHKTIHCYEADEELTVENVKKFKRMHPRCGTSFLLIVMIVSIFVFSMPIVPWNNILLRIVIKISLLPLVAGLSYEIIKLAGKYDNIITRIISAPGMWLQRITTKEPDGSQIEVAIAALKGVLTDKKEDDKW